MLGAFFRGNTTFGVGELLQRLDTIARQFETRQEHLYALTPSYESLKSGRAALTSYAAQKVRDRLLTEQHAAVGPDGGLHVFAPHKKTEPINLRLNWDTYGATTFEDIQNVLIKHQPLAFDLIENLATPERHDLAKNYRYRPPFFVRENLTLCFLSLTYERLQRKCFPRLTMHAIEMRRGYKFLMESYSWLTGQHKLSLTMQADCALLRVTIMCSTSSSC